MTTPAVSARVRRRATSIFPPLLSTAKARSGSA